MYTFLIVKSIVVLLWAAFCILDNNWQRDFDELKGNL